MNKDIHPLHQNTLSVRLLKSRTYLIHRPPTPPLRSYHFGVTPYRGSGTLLKLN